MGLLTREERKKLISLLLTLPNLDDPQTRALLVSGLPSGVRQNTSLGGSSMIFANSLVNDVDADWARSTDGSWPILSLIEAAIALVPGRQLADDLQGLLDNIQARIEPPTPPQDPVIARTGPITPVPVQDITLTVSQRRDLADALLSAFPGRNELEIMLTLELNENLDAIASGGTLLETVVDLLQWAQARGRMADLIKGALSENPRNPKLRSFAEQLGLAT